MRFNIDQGMCFSQTNFFMHEHIWIGPSNFLVFWNKITLSKIHMILKQREPLVLITHLDNTLHYVKRTFWGCRKLEAMEVFMLIPKMNYNT